jgi:hypothetical protein
LEQQGIYSLVLHIPHDGQLAVLLIGSLRSKAFSVTVRA